MGAEILAALFYVYILPAVQDISFGLYMLAQYFWFEHF